MNTHRKAFTLLEVMISVALLAMVMAMVSQSLQSSIRFNDRFMRQTDINNRANDVLNELAQQLRLASSQQAVSMELPGPYPLGFTPANPANMSKVTAYYFAMSRGIKTVPPFDEDYEPFKRMIIYDGSTTPGRLILQTRDDAGNLEPFKILTIDVAENGFSLSRVGNTLQMSLTLRSETRNNEEILYTAQAQTIFLRSSMMKSSGASVVTVKPPVGTTDSPLTKASPTIMLGNLVTEVATNRKQVAIFFYAPIGQELNPKSFKIEVWTTPDKSNVTVIGEGQSFSGVGIKGDPVKIVRQTHPSASEWPSVNGIYSITLEGIIDDKLWVRATAGTMTGLSDYVETEYN